MRARVYLFATQTRNLSFFPSPNVTCTNTPTRRRILHSHFYKKITLNEFHISPVFPTRCWRTDDEHKTFLIFLSLYVYIYIQLYIQKREIKRTKLSGKTCKWSTTAAGNTLIYIKTDRFVWRCRWDVCATASDGPIALFPRCPLYLLRYVSLEPNIKPRDPCARRLPA